MRNWVSLLSCLGLQFPQKVITFIIFSKVPRVLSRNFSLFHLPSHRTGPPSGEAMRDGDGETLVYLHFKQWHVIQLIGRYNPSRYIMSCSMSTMSHVTDTLKCSLILTSMYIVFRESIKDTRYHKINGHLNTISSPEIGTHACKDLYWQEVIRKVWKCQ